MNLIARVKFSMLEISKFDVICDHPQVCVPATECKVVDEMNTDFNK